MIKRRTGTFKSSGTAKCRPVVPPEEKACLITYTKANGQDAWTLWDAGSTTTSITPAFADTAKITAFPLLDPFIVQLGTVGSRAKITHGAHIPINMPGCKNEIYADICNLDRYDMIVGTPFMHQNKVVLDFGDMTVSVNGIVTPALAATREEKGKSRENNAPDLDRLRHAWKEEYADMVNGTPNKLPPLRDINHEIHIVNPEQRYMYHTPRCPQALRSEFYEKLNRYVDSGWWKESTSVQAAPLMCIPK
ncbi:hypothetical protein HYPSUDRAFT_149927, partial [Hypholoma sublateritium FD-334 SS-4]